MKCQVYMASSDNLNGKKLSEIDSQRYLEV